MNKVSQPARPPPDEGDKACTRLSKVQQQFSQFGSRLRALSDPANYQDEDEDLAAARKKASRTSPLAALSDEVMAGACTFLPPSDLIFLSRACQRLRAVALRPHLWRDICLQQWGLAPGTPTHSALMQAPLGPHFLELYPLIEEYPSGFNCSALDADSRSTIHADADEEPVEVKTGAKSAGAGTKTALLVEYTGGVGLGNRCVRTDAPFPSPRIWERRSLAARSARHGAAAGPLALMYKLLRAVHAGGSHSAAATPGAASAALALLGATTCGASVHAAATTPLPFSTPIWTAPGTVDASARVVSYFEVSIAPRTGARGAGVPECIAIGLSEEQFTLQGKMPGWDSCSYGYHSDDGGAFHNAGSMLFRYGPTFGRGDVVGCGLDYSHGGGVCADIFFTLNGRYLGVAFAGVRAGGLYPTVGIDSAAPVRINLGGAAPFAFGVGAFERERRAAAAARARDDAAAAKAAAEARHNTTATRALLLGAAALPALAMARAEAF